MTERTFREGGRTFHVAEHEGIVDQIQTIAKTNVQSLSQGAYLYTPASVRVDVTTVVTQRVFMTSPDGSRWSFDCEDNIPIRQGANLNIRYISSGKAAPAPAYISEKESNWGALRPHIVERFIRPRWRSLAAICAAAIIAIVAVVYQSNHEVRQFYQQAYPPGTGWCLGRELDSFGYPFDGPNGKTCRRVLSTAAYALPAGFAGLWLVWFLRRRSLRQRLYQHLKDPQR